MGTDRRVVHQVGEIQLTYPDCGDAMNYPQSQYELLQGIEEGDNEKVKRLLDSGINLNTVLHSPVRREHATILGTAALEGRLEILQYLLDCKVPVNYQDPCLSRNALHWAAMGGKVEAAKILLENGIDINCQDRDNVTPIIRAAIFGKRDLVEMLIKHGANVNHYDRLHSSALHYASFHGKSDVVTLLVQAGCIENNPAIFGQGTPLANLVYHGDIKNCKLLVEAGYNLSKDTWILKYNFSRKMDRENTIGEFLMKQMHNPTTLFRLCSLTIRKAFCGVRVQEKIAKLPLPSKLVQFVSLEL